MRMYIIRKFEYMQMILYIYLYFNIKYQELVCLMYICIVCYNLIDIYRYGCIQRGRNYYFRYIIKQ